MTLGLPAYLFLELIGGNSDSSCRHCRAGSLAAKGAAHSAASGGAPVVRQPQHRGNGLHHELWALAAAPDLQGTPGRLLQCKHQVTHRITTLLHCACCNQEHARGLSTADMQQVVKRGDMHPACKPTMALPWTSATTASCSQPAQAHLPGTQPVQHN